MEPTTENPVAAALARGYERANDRVQELAADSGLSPQERHGVLLKEAAEALGPIGLNAAFQGERWAHQENAGWESELAADLQGDVTVDGEEMSRRIELERMEVSSRETSLSQEKLDARADLLVDVETLAAHPWNDVDLTSAPGHDDGYGATNREQVVARIDSVLKQSGLAATKDLEEVVPSPKTVGTVDGWGAPVKVHDKEEAVATPKQDPSFPLAPTLTRQASSSEGTWQKAANFVASKFKQGGNGV